MEPSKKHCRSCGVPDHKFKDCTNHKPANPYRPLYDRFKPEQYRPPRSFQPNKKGPYQSFSQVLQHESKNLPPANQNDKDNSINNNIPNNTIDALKFIQEKLDFIDNKLTLIDDEIVSLKNSVIKHEQNQKDIDFRLNRLEYMHYVVHDPEQVDDPTYDFPLHDGDEDQMKTAPIPNVPLMNLDHNDESSSNSSNVNQPIEQTNHLQRINSVETSVLDIKSEIHAISTALRSIIQTPSTINQ